MIDINRMTIGEVAKIEDLSGLSVSAMGDDDSPKAKMMAAIAYVVKRREDPKVTFEDCLSLTMEEISEFLGEDPA